MTPAQLERETEGEPFITYVGIEGRQHRFVARDGHVFLVDRAALEIPTPRAVEDGEGLFVRIRHGRLAPPDVAALTTERERDLPDPDGTAALEAARRAPLEVALRDKSDEPSELFLTSDGDWSREDLFRLDAVLDAWLLDECPWGPAAVAEDRRPSLRYDEARSAADRKTIALRARDFQTEWCESLAHRLGREYPFLWRLEVGERPASAYPFGRSAAPGSAQ